MDDHWASAYLSLGPLVVKASGLDFGFGLRRLRGVHGSRDTERLVFHSVVRVGEEHGRVFRDPRRHADLSQSGTYVPNCCSLLAGARDENRHNAGGCYGLYLKSSSEA